MKKFCTFAAILVSVLLLNSCATIFEGSSQEISIKSTPDKGAVTIKTMGGIEVFSGETPVVAKVSKKHEYLVTIKVEGYKENTVQLSQSLQGWFWGNLICGGIIGMIIDYTSGAMWILEPEAINVTLATAYINGNESQTYAVFRALDNDGQLRMMLVPMIRDNGQVALK